MAAAVVIGLIGIGAGGVDLVLSHDSAVAAHKRAVAIRRAQAARREQAARKAAVLRAAELQVVEMFNYCAMDLSDYVIEMENDDPQPLFMLGQQSPMYQWIIAQVGPYIQDVVAEGQSQAQSNLYNRAVKECEMLTTHAISGRYVAIARIPRASNYTNNSDGSARYPLPGSLYVSIPKSGM